jgi:hypothetical protein
VNFISITKIFREFSLGKQMQCIPLSRRR